MAVILTSPAKGLAAGASYSGADEDWLSENGYARVAGSSRDMRTASSVAATEDPQINVVMKENPAYPGTPGAPKYLYKQRTGLGKAAVPVTGNPLATVPAGSQDHDSDDVLDTDADVTSIDMLPATSTKAAGQTTQLAVTATYADSSTANVTGDATYVSSVPARATVSATGLVSFLTAGATTITATYGGKQDTTAVTVS